MRRPLALTLLLALTLVPHESHGTPGDAPKFEGTLADGAEKAFALPAGKGFWVLTLEGAREGVDLDLRAAAGKRAIASSQGDEATEEVLVPATLKGLTAVVSHHDGPKSAFTLQATALAAGKKLAAGKPVEGRVDATGGAWSVHELPASGTTFSVVSLEAQGEGLDLDLYVYDEDWKPVTKSQEDGAEEVVIVSPSRAARWVVVRAWQGAAAFTLEAGPVGEDAERLTIGETTRSVLETDDVKWFRVRTTAPGIVTVRLEGPAGQDLDLQVFGPGGYYRESAAEDAVEEIPINGAKKGDYLVCVSAGQEGAGGEFTLTTTSLDLSKLATSGKTGQVWALFVGIANYEEVESLTYSGGDALFVYQALRGQGLVDDKHSIVLLDELARRQDIVGALETIGKRAKPDDVFLFFYSGHGGNDAPDGQRGDAKDEAESGDEYLVCQDSTSGDTSGDLVDDDLKGLLDAIACRRQLLFFDACHAGGFAELIDRDGRYGCFSSLETQTSSEALSLKKGLMTSIVVRALQGEADADEDGKVTLAEVSAFVERVQPATCASCQAALAPNAKRCRQCGEDLSKPEGRQIPVIVSKVDGGWVLTEPGKRARRRS